MVNYILMDIERIPEMVAGCPHSGDESHLLREIVRTHQALMNVFTREVGMPGARLALLRLLAICHPEELGVMEIARRLGINAAAVTRQVKEMEAAGLVVRSVSGKDGRYRFVRLTPEGLSVFQRMHERAHAFEEALSASVDAEDIAAALRVLALVRTAIEGLR